MGLVDVPAPAFASAADRLDEIADAARPSSESFVNPAKVLAVELAGSVPVVLGDGDLAGVAAQRAAAMLSRTARTPAVWGELPDDASQVVAAFDGPFTATGAGGTASDDVFADPFLDGAGRTATAPAAPARRPARADDAARRPPPPGSPTRSR